MSLDTKLTQETEKQINEEIFRTGEELFKIAEPGFFEWETHAVLKQKFIDLGFSIREFVDFPGFSATVREDAEPFLGIIGDMDAVPNPEAADGHYMHACGHHMQLTALYGTALYLKNAKPEALEHIAFIATPAEEYIDFDKRRVLIKEGKITAYSGKQELIRRGFFNQFRYIIASHATNIEEKSFISSVRAMGGFEVMRFQFNGITTHAGASPHKGVNAQNAGALFLQACAFLRESFNEQKHIRIHPVLKLEQEQSVNSIPPRAFVETYVRAADRDTIDLTAHKLKEAAKGCAQAIGCTVNIELIKGYAPFKADRQLHKILKEAVQSYGLSFIEEDYSTASSDIGDISQKHPTIMLGLPGTNGLFHSSQFRITDKTKAYLLPAKVMASYVDKVITHKLN